MKFPVSILQLEDRVGPVKVQVNDMALQRVTSVEMRDLPFVLLFVLQHALPCNVKEVCLSLPAPCWTCPSLMHSAAARTATDSAIVLHCTVLYCSVSTVLVRLSAVQWK